MDISLKKLIENILPSPLSKKIISVGKSYKRKKREKLRYSYGKGKPFIRKIDVLGVSFKIVLDPVKNAGVDENISKDGFWEKKLGKQFIKYVKKENVFLDIGANIGYHSLFVASILKGTGKVYSFEPITRLCEQLNQSIEINNFSNIEVCNFGLSENDGEHTIYIRDENTGGSSLLTYPKLDTFKIKETQIVTLKSLDSFLKDIARVDVIKIDVEGYEYEALKGAANILKKNQSIIFMEFSPVLYIQDYTEKPYDLVSFLEKLGYSFFTLNNISLDLKSWLKDSDNIHSQIDIICKVTTR